MLPSTAPRFLSSLIIPLSFKTFWKYAKESDYYEEILAEKEAFDDAKREEEQKMLEGMLENAARIMKEEVTFRRVFESGKEQRL